MRLLFTALGGWLLLATGVLAQNPQPFNPAFAPGARPAAFGDPPPQQSAAQGGGTNADFDSLIDLVINTVASESWAENGGGEAEIRPFVGGVWADPQGTLRGLREQAPITPRTVLVRQLAASTAEPDAAAPPADARRYADLRCVSLTRLEGEIGRRAAAGVALDESMLTLAGLQRAEYVFALPGTREVCLAGPAGDWRLDDEARLVSRASGLPVVRLDDLLTLLRRDPRSPFGCSIDPRPESLARAQRFLAGHAIPRGSRARDRWLSQATDALGLQDLSYQGIPRDSHAACVLGEADYHMKLLGMGKAQGPAGLQSYLDSIRVEPGEQAPALGAVRWWFGMHYAAVSVAADGRAYRLKGQGVRLLSENEALSERGQRAPTGQSDQHAQAYAAAFTSSFAALATKYPVYGELRNLFDLSLVTTILATTALAEDAGWSPGLLANADRLPLPRYAAPTTVETIASLRQVNRELVLASVAGGVWARPVEVLESRRQTATARYGPLSGDVGPPPEDTQRWWWDLNP